MKATASSTVLASRSTLLLEEAAATESEDVDEPERARVNAHAIHFLGPLEFADTSLNEVRASPG